MQEEIGRSLLQIKGFASAELDYQLLRLIGSSAYKGSTIGEALYVANKNSAPTPQQWIDEFSQLASQCLNDAQIAELSNHTISARDHYFRASQYYRTAEAYADPLTNQRELGKKLGFVLSKAFLI